MTPGHPLRRRIATALVWLAILVAGGLVAPASLTAQTLDETGAIIRDGLPMGPGIFQPDALDASGDAPDYEAWETVAASAETGLAEGRLDARGLDRLRGQLVDWREALQGAQSANDSRIANIRSQIAALGPAPAEGLTEAPEIATRRSELTDQLVRLQAPGIKAEEAWQRANGLIGEIDRLRREAQAQALLKLWPSPVNPANWPEALQGLSGAAVAVVAEIIDRGMDATVRAELLNRLPLLLIYLLPALALLWKGPAAIDHAMGALRLSEGRRSTRLIRLLASIGHWLIPALAFLALSLALDRTGLLGPVGQALNSVLARVGVTVWGAMWLAGQLFPATPATGHTPLLGTEARAEVRFIALGLSIIFLASRLRRVIVNTLDLSDAAHAVLIFPVIVLGGIFLFRLGRVLAQLGHAEDEDDEDGAVQRRIFRLLAQALKVVGVVAPLLAAAGYVTAAAELTQPAILSLVLAGFLIILSQALQDGWWIVQTQLSGQRAQDDTAAAPATPAAIRAEGLVPVIVNFALALFSLPMLALIWGASLDDLNELWTRFQSGVTLGSARISPTDFLVFAAILGLGITATRLFQSVLKSTILPRTGMEPGGRNAVASGTGYIGIFLSALVAINATGIDLSGLAIVAGALSVGIGFGLQAIVSNFVSGIILLIERPVSEGDWIEVGPVQGIVKAISVRSTRIQTFDRSDVIVPNQDLITQRVTNWTRFSQSGRVTIPVTVPYTEDPDHIRTLLTDVVQTFPGVLKSPAPQILLTAMAGEVLTFEIRVILRDVFQGPVARSEINLAVARRFREEGVPFSNAHRDQRASEAAFAQDEADLARREAEVALWLAPVAESAVPDPGPAAAPAVATAPKRKRAATARPTPRPKAKA